MIDVKAVKVGMLGTNAYIITDTESGEVALMDPGFKSRDLTSALDLIEEDKIKYILLTHGHFDHIGAVGFYAETYKAKVVISKEDSSFLTDNNLNCSYLLGPSQLKPIYADVLLSEGDTLTLGQTEFRFILTPGHTAGSGCFVFDEDKVIFTGDTLFFCSVGRTDLPTGDSAQIQHSLHRLRGIEGNYTLYPGHDRATTLDYERENNPYLS